MTRFMIPVEDAINLIDHALSLTGVNVIPNIESFRIIDLFEIYKEKFGLEYEIGVPRISEKIHEMMFSSEESARTQIKDRNYIMHYKNVYTNNQLPFNEFTSDKVIVSKDQLTKILEQYGYFQTK